MTAQAALVIHVDNNSAYESLDESSVNLPNDTSFTVSNTIFQNHDPSCQECGDNHEYDSIPATLHTHEKRDNIMSIDGSNIPAT